ncbi:hypothetical protein AAVH_15543 [Aphelenchoides avenae]|nr:hypothetical protein AAVH_15543 [Aphelenchus avenae]
MAHVKGHYKRAHGQWTPSIQMLSRNSVNYNRYLSLLRLGKRVQSQTEAGQDLRAPPDARIASNHATEVNAEHPPFLQEPVCDNDEEHLDALEELSSMADLRPTTDATPPTPSAPMDSHTSGFTAKTVPPATKIAEPAPATLVDFNFATALSRFGPDSESYVVFKAYVIFFESRHATPWWISIDTPQRQRRFREILQQTERRQKQDLLIVSCDLPQKEYSNLARILREHLAVTDLTMLPYDPFLRIPERQKLIHLVNAFPTTLRKLYNLPYPSMLAIEGRKLLGCHEARTVGNPTSNIVDLLYNFKQSAAGSCLLSVDYQNADHLCRSFLPDADYTDLEVRMTTTFTRDTLMHLLHTVNRFMRTIGTLRTTTPYVNHDEPPGTTDSVQFAASVEHFRGHWNALWTWLSTSPKPCNVRYTYLAPATKLPEPTTELYGLPHLTSVSPSVYSNTTTTERGHNIFSTLDLTRKEKLMSNAMPIGSPLERELQTALKNLLDDTFRTHEAATFQTTVSQEADLRRVQATAATPIPSASTSTANNMERPPSSSDEDVANPSSW